MAAVAATWVGDLLILARFGTSLFVHIRGLGGAAGIVATASHGGGRRKRLGGDRQTGLRIYVSKEPCFAGACGM